MKSSLFDLLDVNLAGRPERVLVGGRHLFALLPRAFAGVSRIGVIGWGPQGRVRRSTCATDSSAPASP